MRVFVYVILLGIAALIVTAGWLIKTAFAERKSKSQYWDAIEDKRKQRDTVWKEAEAITDMVNLYMNIICKHRPDSLEAHAFRFGTDSQLMKSLHNDDEAMKAFRQQCDIIDATYLKAMDK